MGSYKLLKTRLPGERGRDKLCIQSSRVSAQGVSQYKQNCVLKLLGALVIWDNGWKGPVLSPIPRYLASTRVLGDTETGGHRHFLMKPRQDSIQHLYSFCS